MYFLDRGCVRPLYATCMATPLLTSAVLRAALLYLQDTCRMAAPDLRHGLEVQRTSVQKQTHLLCPFTFQLGLETMNCLCHHRIIIQHIPLGHHSMREEIFSNIPVAPTFNQLQWLHRVTVT